MANTNPSARAPRTPVTIDVTNPENPAKDTIQAPPPPPLDPPVSPNAAIELLGVAQAEAATTGKPSDSVLVYNRHVGRVAGLEPMSQGRVRRAMLDQYSWALRAV